MTALSLPGSLWNPGNAGEGPAAHPNWPAAGPPRTGQEETQGREAVDSESAFSVHGVAGC
jgi:hypothetical protein